MSLLIVRQELLRAQSRHEVILFEATPEPVIESFDDFIIAEFVSHDIAKRKQMMLSLPDLRPSFAARLERLSSLQQAVADRFEVRRNAISIVSCSIPSDVLSPQDELGKSHKKICRRKHYAMVLLTPMTNGERGRRNV